MLNWRRDPGYEQRMNALAIRIQQTKNETEQIKNDSERIRREAEQLRQENAKGRQLLASIDALCFPPECSSTPAPPTAPDFRPTSS
jgi:hypothetical protein